MRKKKDYIKEEQRGKKRLETKNHSENLKRRNKKYSKKFLFIQLKRALRCIFLIKNTTIPRVKSDYPLANSKQQALFNLFGIG